MELNKYIKIRRENISDLDDVSKYFKIDCSTKIGEYLRNRLFDIDIDDHFLKDYSELSEMNKDLTISIIDDDLLVESINIYFKHYKNVFDIIKNEDIVYMRKDQMDLFNLKGESDIEQLLLDVLEIESFEVKTIEDISIIDKKSIRGYNIVKFIDEYLENDTVNFIKDLLDDDKCIKISTATETGYIALDIDPEDNNTKVAAVSDDSKFDLTDLDLSNISEYITEKFKGK
jgi:hypothetical protein